MYMRKNDENKINITSEYPSFLVENFRTYLTYLSTHQIKLTKAKGYFSKKDLISICSQMKGEKRETPQHATQIGYPMIHLFYQLSIVLDFMKINRYQSSVIAVIQNEQIETYLRLTATEQYFTLLEAFWLETDWDDLQGEKRGKAPDNIDYLFEELERIPANKELKLTLDKKINECVTNYGQFFYYFSYFGFWTFFLDEEKSNDPDRPISTIAKSITLTPLFKNIHHALYETWNPYRNGEMEQAFTWIADQLDLPDEIKKEIETEKTEKKESLVTLVRPLFSKNELTTTLKRKKSTFKAGTYLFKVKLNSSCWRILQFSGLHTLLDLHDLIQKAFDFDDDHLYAFYMDGKKYSKHYYNSPMDPQGPYVNSAKIGGLELYEGQSFLYLFDFGDEWEFNIQVVKISEKEELRLPQIKEKFGEAPDQYSWQLGL